jgi:hypothetical protein
MHYNPPPSSGFTFPPAQRDAPDQSPADRSLRARSGRGWGGVVALVILALLLLIAAAVYFDAVPMLTQGDAQTAAARQFCADEVRQDYAAAYSLLSSDYIHLYSLDQGQFVQALQQRDQQRGPVHACSIAGRDYVRTFETIGGAVFQVTVTLGDGSHTGTITVTNDHGWKVERMDAQLHLDG